MATYNFKTLLKRSHNYTYSFPDGTTASKAITLEIPICIPPIQRDYAEGRNDEKTERKRQNLLNDMLDVVYGVKTDLSFDFIYGYLTNNGNKCALNVATIPGNHVVFEPLDGQQRLTTLFLLYWLFGRKSDITGAQGFIPGTLTHSMLVYKTRPTSEEFCNWLVGQDEVTIIDGWLNQKKAKEKQNEDNKAKWYTVKVNGVIDPIANRLKYPVEEVPTLLDYMKALDDFKWNWCNDPNIVSMLTVLEHTVTLIIEKGWSMAYGRSNSANLDNITFMLLDDLDCDGDLLFEKMNARGKALTSFDVLKSSLEEEIEHQGLSLSNPSLAIDWRDRMDGNWLQYCWDNSNIRTTPDLEDIQGVENKLERILLRMIAKSFYKDDIQGTPPADGAKDYREVFVTSITKDIEKVFDRYLDYIRHERSIKSSVITATEINFQCIFDDIENMLYQDSIGKWHDASQLLPKLHSDNNNTLLDDLTGDRVTHDTRVRIYAMTRYLAIVKASGICTSSVEKQNFIDWMRFIRNIYNSDNMNSQLNTFSQVKTALNAVDDWLDEYKKSYYSNTNPQAVLQLIDRYIANNHNGQESARIEEEALKAHLRLNGTHGVSAADWEQAILSAEENYYLWGQIGAPLSWSKKPNGQYDKKLFDDYMTQLNEMFNQTSWIGDISTNALWIQAVSCMSDYRFNMRTDSDLGSLGTFNNDRDHSWKRYLREPDQTTGYHGVLVKRLLDQWRLSHYKSKPFSTFLSGFVSNRKHLIPKNDWRYFIVSLQDPQTLLNIFNNTVHTSTRYVYTENGGHAYFFKSQTMRTANRYELLTTYLSAEKRLLGSGVTVSDVQHTASTYGAHVELTKGNDVYKLSLDADGKYCVSLNGTIALTGLDVLGVERELIKSGLISGL